MIFVTVGTQLPFDRLVHAVDAWAAAHPEVECFAQIGPSPAPPAHLPHAEFVPPARAGELMRRASLIVAHAGMGSVLTALELRRPIVIVPRRAALGEHRNDHQMATARWLEGRPGITVAWDEHALPAVLDDRARLTGGEPIPRHASGPLVDRLAAVVAEAVRGRRR